MCEYDYSIIEGNLIKQFNVTKHKWDRYCKLHEIDNLKPTK